MGPPESYSMWNERSQTVPQFKFWSMIIELEVHAEFMKGHFVVQKSRRQFSPMAKDQSHEQSNKILQTKGAAAGLYEIHEALMLMPQLTPPIHYEYRVLPAPDLLQRKGCQVVLLPSRKMIYPFRTSLASCAPPRDDLLKMAVGCGLPRTPLPSTHSQARLARTA